MKRTKGLAWAGALVFFGILGVGYATLIAPRAKAVTHSTRRMSPQERAAHSRHNSLLHDAQVALQRGDVVAGESLVRLALKDEPGDVVAWRFLGGLLVQQGRDKEAVSAYEEATRKREGGAWSTLEADPVLLATYAETCERVGDTKKAQSLYQRILNGTSRPAFNAKPDWPAVDTTATGPKVVQGLALVLVGNDQFLSGKRDAAISTFREAVNRAPNCAITHFSLGYALKWRTDTASEALSEFQEAKRIANGDRNIIEKSEKFAQEVHLEIDPAKSRRVR